jgi:hypothetical protein
LNSYSNAQIDRRWMMDLPLAHGLQSGQWAGRRLPIMMEIKQWWIVGIKKSFSSIIVTSLICGGWLLHPDGRINVYAAPLCRAEADPNPAQTKLLPIVRDQASLKKLSEKEVVVLGRYQRDAQKEPLKLRAGERTDPPRTEANKPIPLKDRQVYTSDLSQANIVLADGTVLPIAPRGRRSLRSKNELTKYHGQAISVQGIVRWNPQGFYKTEIDNITNLRLICSVPQSQSTAMNSDEWQGKKLAIVKTKGDALKSIDRSNNAQDNRRVQIVGKYVANIWDPGIDSNSIGFKGTYQQASIQLADGTLIPLLPPDQKSSLRSATEVETYAGKVVKVVGQLQWQPNTSTTKKSSPIMMLTTVDGIWLK